MKKGQLALGGFIITFIGAILFSTKAIIVKKAFADTSMDALTLLTVRMIFSLPFFIAAAFLVNKKYNPPQLSVRQWWQIIALGLFGYYLSSYFDFAGLQYISAGLERLILFLYPTLVLLINSLLFRNKVTGVQWIALVLTYAGIAIAFYDEMKLDIDNPHFILGSFLVFMCSVTYAFYIAGSAKIIPLVGASRFTAYAMLSATAGIFIHFLLRGNTASLHFNEDMWQYGLLLALIATVLPTFMLSAGLKRIGANNAAIISAVGPVSTILQAHWILGENIHRGQITGTLLVIAGVLLIGWKSDTRVSK